MGEELPEVAGFGEDKPAAGSNNSRTRALRARFFDLQLRLQRGTLQTQNEALQAQVLQTQEDFLALQTEFKDMKERCCSELANLQKLHETGQASAVEAEQRVICIEDLVRFYEEQRRLMAAHWKLQCQLKDERIRALNLQLTEYTIDWHHLGSQKRNEASLSHEMQCLQDRHTELLAVHRKQQETYISSARKLEEVTAEVAELSEELDPEDHPQSVAPEPSQCNSARVTATRLKDTAEGLQSQLRLVKEWIAAAERAEEEHSQENHLCIWRDELDVRESQLERITAQLDHTNQSLNAAQADLTAQRARHEEMKTKHAEAEARMSEEEQKKGVWQRKSANLRRAEAELRAALQVRESSALTAAAVTAAVAGEDGLPRAGSGLAGSAFAADGGFDVRALHPQRSLTPPLSPPAHAPQQVGVVAGALSLPSLVRSALVPQPQPDRPAERDDFGSPAGGDSTRAAQRVPSKGELSSASPTFRWQITGDSDDRVAIAGLWGLEPS